MSCVLKQWFTMFDKSESFHIVFFLFRPFERRSKPAGGGGLGEQRKEEERWGEGGSFLQQVTSEAERHIRPPPPGRMIQASHCSQGERDGSITFVSCVHRSHTFLLTRQPVI